MQKTVIAAIASVFMMLISFTPVFASPAPGNPGKGHPEFDRFVFVHYADSFAKKAGGGSQAPQLYSYSGYHWNRGNVPYSINLNNSRPSQSNAVNGIKASFKTWEDDTASTIVFVYSGTTGAAPGLNVNQPDYQNVVGWADLSNYPDAIGVTIVWATRGNKVIVDADTALNISAQFAWTQVSTTSDPDMVTLPPTGSYDVDIQNIMTHEAGHWLQLNDLYSAQASEQTMYGYSSDGELKKRTLEGGDIAGLAKIY
jgi:hypothetical protein